MPEVDEITMPLEGATGLYLFTPRAIGYFGKKHVPLKKVDEVGLEALLKDRKLCVVPIEINGVETETTFLGYLVGRKDEELTLYEKTVQPVNLSDYAVLHNFSASNNQPNPYNRNHIGLVRPYWNPIHDSYPVEVLFSDLPVGERKEVMNSLDGAFQGDNYALKEGSAMFPKTLGGEMHGYISS